MKRLLLSVALLTIITTSLVAEPPAKKTDEQAKEQFIKIVKANAEDPAGLEIISWGERKTQPDGAVEREIKFRCTIIAYRRGVPVRIDHAIIEYKGNHISRVYLNECFRFWNID